MIRVFRWVLVALLLGSLAVSNASAGASADVNVDRGAYASEIADANEIPTRSFTANQSEIPTLGLRLRDNPKWNIPFSGAVSVHRPFIAPETRYSSGHRGVDFTVSAGSQVLAPADGVVHYAGFIVDRPVLSIRHEGGYLSSLEPVSAAVAEGDTITRGQTVGFLDSSNHCDGQVSSSDTESVDAPVDTTVKSFVKESSPHTNNCLHVGARLNGEYINPMILFGMIVRPVLLPLR